MKRIFAVLLCVVMMLSVLTACSDSGTAGTETPAETAAPAPTEAAAETPAQQDVTLHLFHQKQEAQEAFAMWMALRGAQTYEQRRRGGPDGDGNTLRLEFAD